MNMSPAKVDSISQASRSLSSPEPTTADAIQNLRAGYAVQKRSKGKVDRSQHPPSSDCFHGKQGLKPIVEDDETTPIDRPRASSKKTRIETQPYGGLRPERWRVQGRSTKTRIKQLFGISDKLPLAFQKATSMQLSGDSG